MDEFARQRKGEWISRKDPKSASSIFLCYHKQIEEWTRLLLHWAKESHIVSGFICTAYELIHGSNTQAEPFHNMHPLVLKYTLQSLETRSLIRILYTDTADAALDPPSLEYGVKFIHI